jgi:hypothetical protein
VKAVAAERTEENKPQEIIVDRQLKNIEGLPHHDDRTEGNVKTAENKEIEYLTKETNQNTRTLLKSEKTI